MRIGQILGLAYERLDSPKSATLTKSADLATATRRGRRYSENHMGFGEGRILYMVHTVESAPDNSLFVLEEPETALHGDAQRRLARYLVDVVDRKRHQVILTTHSAAILGELERDSVVYLGRSADGDSTATTGLSTCQVHSFLSERLHGRATVCVEDEFAKLFAIEIVRRCDPHLLAGSDFQPFGAAQDIPRAVDVLRNVRARAVGLCDGDMRGKVSGSRVGYLPGDEAPEKVVFTDTAVVKRFSEPPYCIDLEEIVASVSDHHGFAEAIAARTMTNDTVIITDACRAYVDARPVSEFAELISHLKGQLSDRQ